MPTELEPSGLCRTDGKRPDGATIIPWTHGKCAVWDFTTPDCLAPSHVNQASVTSGAVAVSAEGKKQSKYSSLNTSCIFYPFAIETLGGWGPGAIKLSGEIGSKLAIKTGESRSTSFLRQRLDIAVQRGNAAAVRGTIADSRSDQTD